MHILPTLLTLLLLESTSALGNSGPKYPKNSILLSNVKALTLHGGKKTTSRRLSPIPQLTCVGPACAHHSITLLQCKNVGSDYGAEDIQWSCTASLPEEFKLGETEVTCEGYENSNDERVLKGSCGVRYRLLFTEKGEERFGGGGWWGMGGGGKGAGNMGAGQEEGWGWSQVLFGALFIGVLGWMVYSAYLGARNGNQIPRRQGGRAGWGGGGGGGGGDGWDDPPPPYPGKRSSTTRNTRAQEGWRPGFWTGAAAGAAGAYLAGNRGGRQQPAPVRNNTGWFGGNDNGSGSWGSGPSRSSGSGSSGSGARHESTGFGSTSRR